MKVLLRLANLSKPRGRRLSTICAHIICIIYHLPAALVAAYDRSSRKHTFYAHGRRISSADARVLALATEGAL